MPLRYEPKRRLRARGPDGDIEMFLRGNLTLGEAMARAGYPPERYRYIAGERILDASVMLKGCPEIEAGTVEAIPKRRG